MGLLGKIRNVRVNPDQKVALELHRCMPLHPQQAKFVYGSDRFFQYFLGGVGCGKTFSLAAKAVFLSLRQPGIVGCLYARTGRDIEDTVMPAFMAVIAILSMASGLTLIRSEAIGKKEVTLINGSVVRFRAYDQINKVRGPGLAWAGIDELEYCVGSPAVALQTIAGRVRTGIPRYRQCFVGSTPRGLRGGVREFLEKLDNGSTSHFLTHSTVFQNPWAFDLQPPTPCHDCHGAVPVDGCERCGDTGKASSYIDTLRAGCSRRQWLQEALGRVLKSQAAIYHEYDESQHLIPWTWRDDLPYVMAIDWGSPNHAYFAAIQVLPTLDFCGPRLLPAGSWVVAYEEKHDQLSRAKFRDRLKAFVARRGRPFMIAADQAISDENAWARREFHGTPVRVCDSKKEQRVVTGVSMMQSMLEPMTGPPILYVSDELKRQLSTVEVGIRGALIGYSYAIDPVTKRPTTTILHDDIYTHPADAVRYAVIKGAKMTELHAGEWLPYAQFPHRRPAEAA